MHRRYRKIIWATQPHSNTTDLSKLCIIFFAIIFRERGTSHQHVIACRSNKWQAGRKTEKSLESNYFWITGWHYQVPVLHICQFSPYTLPLLIFPLFVLSIMAHVSKCGLYETLRTNASWLISLLGKLVLLIFCATDSFCCVYLCCAGGSELSRVDDGLFSGQKLPTTSKEISRCSWVRWNMCSHQYFREMWVCPELDFYFKVSGIIKHTKKGFQGVFRSDVKTLRHPFMLFIKNNFLQSVSWFFFSQDIGPSNFFVVEGIATHYFVNGGDIF